MCVTDRLDKMAATVIVALTAAILGAALASGDDGGTAGPLDWRGEAGEPAVFYAGEAERARQTWASFGLDVPGAVQAVASANFLDLMEIRNDTLRPGQFLWAPGFSLNPNRPVRPLSVSLCNRYLESAPGPSSAQTGPGALEWGATDLPDWVDEGLALQCAPEEVHAMMWRLLATYGRSASFSDMLGLPHPAASLRAYNRPALLSDPEAEGGARFAQATPDQSDLIAFQLFDATAFAMVAWLIDTEGPERIGQMVAEYRAGQKPDFAAASRDANRQKSTEAAFNNWLTARLATVRPLPLPGDDDKDGANAEETAADDSASPTPPPSPLELLKGRSGG